MRGIAAVTALMVLGMTACGLAEDAKGNLRYSITVSKFKNEAGWRGKWDVGDGFTTILTDSLNASGNFIVLGDSEMRDEAMAEQDLASSGRIAGGSKAPQTGRMTGAQLLVRGSITHVQEDTSGGKGGLAFRGIRVGGSGAKAEINITIYLVDSTTGQVKGSTKVVGSSQRKGLKLGYSGAGLGGLTGDLAGFKNDNVGKACEDAVSKAVEYLVAQLESVPWEGKIVLVKPGKIIVNRGTREGVTAGMEFDVGSVEEIIDPDTGELLDSEMTKLARLKVTSVKEKLCYCTASHEDKLENGMGVFPAEGAAPGE